MQPLKNRPAKHHLLIQWRPKGIERPTIDRRLQQRDALSRSTECIRYVLLSIEHWISPDGRIREWLRTNVRFSTLLIIPTVTAFPVVTIALWELEAWVNALTTIASKLIFLPILALLALVSVAIVLRIFSAFKR